MSVCSSTYNPLKQDLAYDPWYFVYTYTWSNLLFAIKTQVSHFPAARFINLDVALSRSFGAATVVTITY